MPEVFIKTWNGLRDIIIDWTEFKLQEHGNYDLSTLAFSNYKNTHNGKSLVAIFPNGMKLMFIEIYLTLVSQKNLLRLAALRTNMESCQKKDLSTKIFVVSNVFT